MDMVFGEERLFRTNTLSVNSQDYHEFYLRFLGVMDDAKLKMSGDFPELWNIKDNVIRGPELFDDDYLYCVTNINYGKKQLWLRQV